MPIKVNLVNRQVYLNKNAPLDSKVLIENMDKLDNVTMPYKGMLFTVLNDGNNNTKCYVVTKLADGYFKYGTKQVVREKPSGIEWVDYEVAKNFFVALDGYQPFTKPQDDLINGLLEEIKKLKNQIVDINNEIINIKNSGIASKTVLTDKDGNTIRDSAGDFLAVLAETQTQA